MHEKPFDDGQFFKIRKQAQKSPQNDATTRENEKYIFFWI